MPDWTIEQQQAIALGGDLIVSAAAGAGKTAVLTERLARIVSEGTPVERLLVLTFTRAAAAEMKARIGNRLFSLAEAEQDPAKASFLRLQAANADRAYITTIDAFCSRILSRHGHLIGLSPKLRVADETELSVLSERAMDDALTALAVEKDENYARLLHAFGSEKATIDAVLRAVRFFESEPDPEGFVARALEKAQSHEATDLLLQESVKEAQDALLPRIAALKKARAFTSDPKVLSVLDNDLSQLGALLLLSDYDEYRAALCSVSYLQLRFARGTTDADKDPVRLPREAAKELVKSQQAYFLHTADEEHAIQNSASRVLHALFFVTRRFLTAFSERKREQGVIDFADMEHMALTLLSIASVQTEYREKFCHIAVDEYQDSNRLQEAILQRIKRPGNLFLVGDVKQSIYRFRSAEPMLFLDKLKQSEQGALTRIDLSKNFRSGQAVIDAVNRTFCAIMTWEAGGLCYDARAQLVPGMAQATGGAELHVIDKAQEESPDETLEDAADASLEARLVAENIRNIMAEGMFTDPKTGKARPYRYEDFAVLLRANTHAATFARELSLSGVPCYAQSTGGYFDALEVVLLLNLLAAIDNPQQDVPLLSALTSSTGAFSFAALAGMRARCPDGNIAACLAKTAEEDSEEGEKARAFLQKLSAWRSESRLISVERLIALLLDETGFYEEMGVLPGGAERQANILALLSKAHAYEKTGARSLFGFLSYMERAKKTASVGAAQTAKADVVRILSMHKSKGLEYPVVFLCQLGKRFDKRDSREPLLLDHNLGAGLRFIDPDTHLKTDTLARKRLASAIAFDSLAEEMRVLYVAMTRAKSRLIMIGSVRDAAPFAEPPDPGPPSADDVRSARSPLDWLRLSAALPASVHQKSALLFGIKGASANAMPPPDPMLVRAIETRLGWTYPFAASGALPSRASVSRLHNADSDVYALPEFAAPAFIEGEFSNASSRGTTTHLLLQYLPKTPLDADGVFALAESLVAAGRMTRAQAEGLYLSEIASFTHSALFARMQKSPRVERELPFSLNVPARRVFAFESDETVLLQGVIDCCFLEEDAWVVVDYKTDRILPGTDPEAVAKKHAPQVRLYAEALERLTRRRVKACIVCLLRANKAIEV